MNRSFALLAIVSGISESFGRNPFSYEGGENRGFLGKERRDTIDRITRTGDEYDISGSQKLKDVAMLLWSDQRKDLCSGIQLDAEPPFIH